MNQQTQQMLQQLADKLGVTVQYLWAALIKGNRIEGAILFGWVAFGIVAGIVSYKAFRRGFKHAEDHSYDDRYWIAGWVSLGISALAIVTCTYWAVMDTFCPEYGALYDILSHVK